MTSFRSALLLACTLLFGVSVFIADPASAQRRPGGDDSGQQEDEEPKDDKGEWSERNLNLKQRRAAGPCPFVKVLYDAARYHEFKDNKELLAAAQWTGEIQGVSSDCIYKSEDPIRVEMKIGFSLGRGPVAEGRTKVYRYWVAVTERDQTVLAKEMFSLPVTFPEGQDRVDINTVLENIVIPRKEAIVSGSNFEILIGFDVTPQMIEFNRDGKHFRYVAPPPVKR